MCNEVSDLGANTTGDAHGDWAGSLTLALNIFSTWGYLILYLWACPVTMLDDTLVTGEQTDAVLCDSDLYTRTIPY